MFNLIPGRHIVRRISNIPQEVYLTFDDGPMPGFTEQVLDRLAEANSHAAFFLIGKRAREHQEIVKRIISEGHSIFSHSSDHNYFNYFRSPFYTKSWIQDSLRELEDFTGIEQRVFRPPGGIIPPPVWIAAKVLEVPLVLWEHRFYDYFHGWRENLADKSLKRIQGGDIILLHDWQRDSNKQQFLTTLGQYLTGLKSKKLSAAALSTDHILRESGLVPDSSSLRERLAT